MLTFWVLSRDGGDLWQIALLLLSLVRTTFKFRARSDTQPRGDVVRISAHGIVCNNLASSGLFNYDCRHAIISCSVHDIHHPINRQILSGTPEIHRDDMVQHHTDQH